MPVILEPKDWKRWPDPQGNDAARLQSLLRLFAGAMTAYPVSPLVNSPKNYRPKCVEIIA
jgi:putative SOS response-associated peptidase YedK